MKTYKQQEFITTTEMADLWNINYMLVEKWCEENKIVNQKIKEDWYVLKGQTRPLIDFKDFNVYGVAYNLSKFNMHNAYAILYFNYVTFEVTAILSNQPFTESEILTGSVVIIDKKTPHSIDSVSLTSEELITLCYEEYVSYTTI